MKAGHINSVTWNYLGKPNCVLIEYYDGSSVMIPDANQEDELTIQLIDGITKRWHYSQMYDIF